MLHSYSRFACIAFAVLLAACSEDESPVAGNSPCADANGACLTLKVSTDEMTHQEYYDPDNDETTHTLRWDPGSAILDGYGPGERVTVTVIFDPPLVVLYEHQYESFGVTAGLGGGGSNRFATTTGDVASPEWAAANVGVNLRGDCTTDASNVDLSAFFTPIDISKRLQNVSFDFTVPDKYTTGGQSGTPILAGDLPVPSISLSMLVSGDRTGLPPVWQGERLWP